MKTGLGKRLHLIYMNGQYKCLIADDSLLDRDAVEMYLSQIDMLRVEATCSNGLEAAAVLQQNEIDIVFSDIDMPGLSGIQLKQSITRTPVFIFISSYAEHAAESYNLDVIDFVVKPVSKSRLLKAVNKAIEYIELKKKLAASAADASVQQITATPVNTNEYFYIRDSTGYTRIDNDDLLFIESMGNFSRLHTAEQKKHITLVSLKNIEQQLPASLFMRVHKQYIINLHHMVSLSAEGEVLLSSGHSIPAGAIYKNGLLDFVNTKTLVR